MLLLRRGLQRNEDEPNTTTAPLLIAIIVAKLSTSKVEEPIAWREFRLRPQRYSTHVPAREAYTRSI